MKSPSVGRLTYNSFPSRLLIVAFPVIPSNLRNSSSQLRSVSGPAIPLPFTVALASGGPACSQPAYYGHLESPPILHLRCLVAPVEWRFPIPTLRLPGCVIIYGTILFRRIRDRLIPYLAHPEAAGPLIRSTTCQLSRVARHSSASMTSDTGLVYQWWWPPSLSPESALPSCSISTADPVSSSQRSSARRS